jgi:anti-anti-sigma factor
MREPFSIQRHDHGVYTILALSGAFASIGFAQFRDALKNAMTGTNTSDRYIVIDLSNTTLLTSSCLEEIYKAKTDGEKRLWHCVIVAPTKDMQELFQVTGFDRFVPMYDSLEGMLKEKRLSAGPAGKPAGEH